MTNERLTEYVRKYLDTVFRVAFNYLKSAADAEDVAQNVFLKLLGEKQEFASEAHVKHWLIRVTVNECKDLKRSRWWNRESFENYAGTLTFDQPEHSILFHAVMELPKKYRLPIYLHYYEGYSTQEIADLLNIRKSTVCSQLMRGREMLKYTL